MDIRSLKRFWQEYQKRRLLKAFYAHERTRPKSEKFFRYFLVLIGAMYLIFWKTETFDTALRLLGIIILTFICAYILTERMEMKYLEQKCRKNIAAEEFRKRVERAGWEEIIAAISEKLAEKYGVQKLCLVEDRIEGTYQEKDIAVYYCAKEADESVETRDIISIIKKCRRDGINEVRVFTNNEFSLKAKTLGERFDINLILYDGNRLKTLLHETSFTPLPPEIDSLIKRESEKRKRRIAFIKEQALQGEKYFNYLIYGSLLMVMAWFEIGIVILNLAFGSIMYVLFVYTLYKKVRKKKEELNF